MMLLQPTLSLLLCAVALLLAAHPDGVTDAIVRCHLHRAWAAREAELWSPSTAGRAPPKLEFKNRLDEKPELTPDYAVSIAKEAFVSARERDNLKLMESKGELPEAAALEYETAKCAMETLLKNTGNKITQVASEMRFESPEELTRFFKRETGFAPKDYRKHYHPAPH